MEAKVNIRKEVFALRRQATIKIEKFIKISLINQLRPFRQMVHLMGHASGSVRALALSERS